MIRMIQNSSAAHAKAYFSDALAKSDYYISDQELAGYWEGKLAGRLGLSGVTAKEAFFALAENRHPMTGEHLTPRTKDDRTTGYDINFHCPKSVSILHVLSEDNHILTAFQESVSETMRAIEADGKTRVRMGGTYADRETGELVWAHFVHQTARPVEGFLPDLHLHSHCFVFNATWDEEEKRVKAGQFRDIKRDMPFYQAMFHKTLADKLIDLGYGINHSGKSFEIENVPQKVIDLFSKRTDEIGRIAKEKGITDAQELDALGARSRAGKIKGLTMQELKQGWKAQIASLGTDKTDGEKTIRHAPKKEVPQITAEECLDHAVLHCFERASVMQERRLLETAYKFALGRRSVSLNAITQSFKADKRLLHVPDKSQNLCTTKEALQEEEQMVRLARQGRGKLAPLYDEAPPLKAKGQAAAAITHVLTTSHRVSIVKGAAGSGKTTLMQEAVPLMQAAGKTVVVVSPSSDMARDDLRNAGFTKADTVARLLVDKKMQQELKGQVLWVDEAGLLGTKDMLSLLDLATKYNAQVILGGDTRQHAAVVRGDALRILSTVGGIRSAEVNKIYRQQKEDYRKAVEDLAKGEVASGFKKLDAIGFIKTLDPLNPNKMLVDGYLESVKKGKDTLIISPTHAQGEALTRDIRERLRAEGLLGKKEIPVTRLKDLKYTEAEKKDLRNIKQGQIIQFTQNAQGIQCGSLWTVEKVTDKETTLKDHNGKTAKLPVIHSNRYDVFQLEEIPLSKGDKIRITRPSFDKNKKRLETGQILTVTAVSKDCTIELKNEKSKSKYTLDKSFGHLNHAHVITSNASQGKTVDVVFIFQPAATFAATNAKQFYVSVSRAKETTHIYTDDKQALLENASNLAERLSAIELMGKHHAYKNIIEKQVQKNQPAPAKKQPPTKPKERDYEPDI